MSVTLNNFKNKYNTFTSKNKIVTIPLTKYNSILNFLGVLEDMNIIVYFILNFFKHELNIFVKLK